MHRFGRSRCRRRSSIHCPRARLGPVLGTTHRKEAEDSDNNGRGMVIIPSERQCLLLLLRRRHRRRHRCHRHCRNHQQSSDATPMASRNRGRGSQRPCRLRPCRRPSSVAIGVGGLSSSHPRRSQPRRWRRPRPRPRGMSRRRRGFRRSRCRRSGRPCMRCGERGRWCWTRWPVAVPRWPRRSHAIESSRTS